MVDSGSPGSAAEPGADSPAPSRTHLDHSQTRARAHRLTAGSPAHRGAARPHLGSRPARAAAAALEAALRCCSPARRVGREVQPIYPCASKETAAGSRYTLFRGVLAFSGTPRSQFPPNTDRDLPGALPFSFG